MNDHPIALEEGVEALEPELLEAAPEEPTPEPTLPYSKEDLFKRARLPDEDHWVYRMRRRHANRVTKTYLSGRLIHDSTGGKSFHTPPPPPISKGEVS